MSEPLALIANVTFDAADPERLSEFWRTVTGYDRAWDAEGIVILTHPERKGPRLLFLRVPEGKTAKNRVHLDLDAVGDPRALVDRLLEMGATAMGGDRSEWGARWVTLQDPEGNELCVHVPHDGPEQGGGAGDGSQEETGG